MKKILSIAVSLCLAFTLVIGSPMTFSSAENHAVAATKHLAGYYHTTKKNNLNMRAKASSSSEKIAVISPDSKIKVSAVSGSWGKTVFSGRTGWINLSYAGYYGKHVPGTYQVNKSGGLELKAEGSVKSKTRATIPNKKNIEISRNSAKWGKVSYNGKTGWVLLKYVSLVKDALDNPYVLPSEDVTVTTRSYTSLKISWPNIPDAAGYYVYRSEKAKGNYAKVGTVNSSATVSFNDTKLKKNTAYYYKVEAFRKGTDNVQRDMPVDGVCGFTGAKAARITSARWISGSTSVSITWNKPSFSTGYVLYRSTSKTGTYKRKAIFKHSTTSFINKGLTTNKTYYYKIKSKRVVNGTTYYSDLSAPVSVYVKAPPRSDYKTGYYRVTSSDGLNLRAEASTDSKLETIMPCNAKIKVSSVYGYWGYTTYAGRKGWTNLKYTSYYGKYKPGTYKVTSSDGVTLRAKADAKSTRRAVIPKNTKIKILKSSGKWGKTSYKGKSGWVSMKYVSLVKDVINNPNALKTSEVKVATLGYKTLKVSWVKVPDATGYYIYRSSKADGDYSRIKKIDSVSTLSFRDTDLERNKAYYYRVETYRSNISRLKGSVSAKGVCGYTGSQATSITSVKCASETSAVITWKKPKYATHYILFRSTKEDEDYKKVGLFKYDTTSFTNTKLTTNKTYYYKIKTMRVMGKDTYYSAVSEAEKVLVKAPPSSVKTYDVTKPTSLYKGSAFTLKGTVKSAYPITRIKVGIKDDNKNWMKGYYVVRHPDKTSYSLSNVDPYIEFNKLKEGTYYYAIHVTDSKGYKKTVLSSEFTIVTIGDSSGTYRWPVGFRPIDITTYFSGQWSSGGHQGIDICKPGGSYGKAIYAARAGFVQIAQTSWTKTNGSYGQYVKLLHADGYATLYAHCSKLCVKEGESVKKGQKIAEIGDTGYSFGAHLHFEVIKPGTSNTRVNPLNYLPPL